MSFVVWLTPWKPATMAMWPASRALWMRPGCHVDDAGGAVGVVGDDAGLAAGEGPRLGTELRDGHRDERHRDALARGEQHVELACRRRGRDLLGEVHQLVRRVAHRRDDDAHGVPGPLRLDDAPGHALDGLGVGHGRTAVLLDDDAHTGSGSPRWSAVRPSLGSGAQGPSGRHDGEMCADSSRAPHVLPRTTGAARRTPPRRRSPRPRRGAGGRGSSAARGAPSDPGRPSATGSRTATTTGPRACARSRSA